MQYLVSCIEVIGYLILIFIGVCVLEVFVGLSVGLLKTIINACRRSKDEKDN